MFSESKSKLILKSTNKYVNKPSFVFILQISNTLQEASKSSPKIFTYLQNIPTWEPFFTKELQPEITKQKITNIPTKGGFSSFSTNSLSSPKEETKSVFDLLFEKLTMYDYSSLVDQPVEDFNLINPEETNKYFLIKKHFVGWKTIF